jgi:Na+-translocating ferredoxin:NAD+ oxidoreductase subunit B
MSAISTPCDLCTADEGCMSYLADIKNKTASKQMAWVREKECIGCTKCIQACPVDAILGSNKQMHTVITSLCTGCGLCLPPCPVDCIDLVRSTEGINQDQQEINEISKRFHSREARIAKQKLEKSRVYHQKTLGDRKSYVQAAINRAMIKKKINKQI